MHHHFHNFDIKDLKSGILTSVISVCYHALQPIIYVWVISGESITSANAKANPIIESVTNSDSNISNTIIVALITLIIGVVGSFILRGLLADKDSLFRIIVDILIEKVKFKKLGQRIKNWAEKSKKDNTDVVGKAE